MKRFSTAALLASAALLGCAGRARDAAAVEAPPHLARICAVRPEETARDLVLVVRDNGRVVAATSGATYACWLAAPGAHAIVSDGDDTGPTLVTARPGGRTWIHQEVTDLGGDAHAHLDVVDEETARELIEACDARVMVSVPGHDESPSAMRIAPAL